MQMLDDSKTIITHAISQNLPGQAVINTLQQHVFSGDIYLLSVGKAAWSMTEAAMKVLGGKIKSGLVITKYGHINGSIPEIEMFEAGHPLTDENSIIGTNKALAMADMLKEGDELLFLISGGGSALFEKPLEGVSLDDIIDVNQRLLAVGADIVEINTIRKRLSLVKGGRFVQRCAPAKVFAVALSDVLGDRPDCIASGPTVPDTATINDVQTIIKKYNLVFNDIISKYLAMETPKAVSNAETIVIGGVSTLCESVASIAAELSYQPHILCTDMSCEAREAGRMLSAMARQIGSPYGFRRPCALIMGGETVVHLSGSGKGGRNQELALAAAEGIDGMEHTVIFSVGSDGTDGPTDAAGGIVNGDSMNQLRQNGINIDRALSNNDAYNALESINGLIKTGPTGTNVNDVAVILCK